MKRREVGLETLLDLSGEAFVLSPHLFVTFKATLVTPQPEVPHGIKYALNLMDKRKTRILGFDNSHGFREHRRVEWDHQHQQEKVFPYEFISAERLLDDFWAAVNRYLETQI